MLIALDADASYVHIQGMKKIAAITGSPRADGVSTRLLNCALGVFEDHGWEAVTFDACRDDYSACTACQSCHQTGRCVFGDSASVFLAELENADALLVASPVYFYSLSSQLKRFIDRCQPSWAQRFVLGPRASGDKPCGFIAVAGGKENPNVFVPGRLVMNVFANSVGFDFAHHLKISGSDHMDADTFANHKRDAEGMARRMLSECGG